MRRTLGREVVFAGIGLHGGQQVRLRIRPAEAGTGIVFLRSDIGSEHGLIPARYDLVSDTRLCTRLANANGPSVSTVEHVMAAIAAMGISDVMLEVDGPEVPIMDGSAQPFLTEMLRAGVRELGVPRRAIRILKPVTVTEGDRRAALLPAARPEIAFTIEFDDPAIGQQSGEMALTGEAFLTDLADCRTFCQLSEVEMLRKIGLARGGGLENAIVVDRGRVLNPEGLRRADEFVRHKMLDAIGDLALAGAPIIGRYEGLKAGHGITNALLRALFERPDAWEWVEADALTPPASRVHAMALGARDQTPAALAV